MSKLTDRVSYIKGLMDGIGLNMDKDTNKVLSAAIDVMEEMAAEIQTLEEKLTDLSEYVDDMDEDLAGLEADLYDDEDEAFDDDEDDDDDEDEQASEEITYDCPSCGHEMVFDADSVDFNEDYRCPACGKPVFPELMDGDEEDEDDEIEIENPNE